MQSFSIILSKDKSSRYFNLIGIFCLLCNAVLFARIWLNPPSVWDKLIGVAGLMLCVLTLLLRLLVKKSLIIHSLAAVFSFFILGVMLISAGIFLPGLCDLLFSLAAFFAGKSKKIIFSEEGIKLPFLFAGFTAWDKFSNVMSKDQVLTFDFKNNKLIQIVIDPALNPALLENEFNQFCQTRLSASSQAD